MTADQQPCWICKSVNTRIWKNRNLSRELIPEDFKITDSRYGVTLSLLRCADCGFIFASSDEVHDLVRLYERLDDPDYEQGMDTRAIQMQWLLSIGKSEHPGAKSLLEIGSGSGLLLKEACLAGLDAVGVEPSRALVATAERINGVKVLQGTYPHPEIADRRFDLVYLVDVIEHVDRPLDLLKSCREALNAGGRLVVVTPDISSLAARALGKRWWHLRLAHVGYFDDQSMKHAAEAAKLRVVHTRRASWFFPLRYLLERAAVYLPLAPLNRWSHRVGALRNVYDRTVRVNLHDSTVFVMGQI